MFDLNNLKQINDLHGHKAGDSAIKIAAGIICRVFPYSSVFRIGGDEFVVVLQGIEYENRSNLLVEFDKQVKENKDKAVEKYEAVSIARGMSVFDPQVDKNYQQVFERADAAMYQNKKIFHSASQMANNNTSRSPS
jgi:diguanylate cyclase (GGDEF)-like protein